MRDDTYTRKTIRRLGIAGTIALAGFSLAAVPLSGFYDVSATTRHSRPFEWFARTTLERSIAARAADIAIPPGMDLRDRALAARAIGHYSAACRTCHGAPGAPRDPWVVLYPEAPDLTRAEVVGRWSDRELFWIVKNGIKDTGMIALGPTHKESDLWAVAAFVRQLPEMTPETYSELAEHAHHRH